MWDALGWILSKWNAPPAIESFWMQEIEDDPHERFAGAYAAGLTEEDIQAIQQVYTKSKD